MVNQTSEQKAFSGQLVPQDPNDEPASELLARIQAEKAAALATKKVASDAAKLVKKGKTVNAKTAVKSGTNKHGAS